MSLLNLVSKGKEGVNRYTYKKLLIGAYESHIRGPEILWTGGSAPLLCRRRRWLLCQVV